MLEAQSVHGCGFIPEIMQHYLQSIPEILKSVKTHNQSCQHGRLSTRRSGTGPPDFHGPPVTPRGWDSGGPGPNLLDLLAVHGPPPAMVNDRSKHAKKRTSERMQACTHD